MKMQKWNEGLDNIDVGLVEKYVKQKERIENKQKAKSVWLRVSALAACFAIIVTAVPVALMLNREDTDEKPKVTTPVENIVVTPGGDIDKTVTKIIYCDASTAAEIKKLQKDNEVEIRDIGKIETNLSSKVGNIEEVANIPARVYKTIGGKDYVFNFNSAYTNKLSTSANEQLKKQGSVAVYNIEETNYSSAKMEYCFETGKIIRIKLQDFSEGAKPNGNFTAEQITLVAQRELIDIYGNEFAQTYTHEKTYVWNDGIYSVEYRRMICGYPTNEIIKVSYNFDGELIYLTAQNYGSFACLDDSKYLDEKAILAAEDAALKLIDEKTDQSGIIHDKELTVDKDGSVYLYVVYEKYNEYNKPLILTLYYKIN